MRGKRPNGWKPRGELHAYSLLSTGDAARYLGMSPRAVRQYAVAGELPVEAETIGGQYIFTGRAVVAFGKRCGQRRVEQRVRVRWSAPGQYALPLYVPPSRPAKPQPWNVLRFRMAKATLPDREVNQGPITARKRHVV